jgi:CBS domain-containing protein
MSHDLVVVPPQMSARDAVRLLHRAGASAAPVVDDRGRCVGLLSTPDVLRWVDAGCPEAVAGPGLTCPYRARGRLLTGGEAVICTLADGSCPFQAVQPTTGGRHQDICTRPATERPPFGVVPRYITTDVVTVRPQAPLPELVRKITDGRVDHLVVVDESGRPVGIVSAKGVLNAVAKELANEP